MGSTSSAGPQTTSQGKCQGNIGKALERSQESQLNLYFDKIIEVQSAVFEKGVAYNNVIVTVIYAGAILLANEMKTSLHFLDWAVSLSLIATSLIFYAVWTVATAYKNSKVFKVRSNLLSDSEKTVERKLAELNVLERQTAYANLRFFAAWIIFFMASLITGFLGAIYLLALYVANLLGFSPSPMNYLFDLF